MKHPRPALLLVAPALLLTGCGRPPGPRGGPPADMQVLAVLAPANTEAVGDLVEVAGELVARDAVELVSEVDARLVQVGFEDGARVATGQELFRFDETRFRARHLQAAAEYELARATLERSRELFGSDTIPRQELDHAEARHSAAEAALALAAADLRDTRLVAPFDGRITRKTVSAGQFVARGRLLATLVRSDDPDVLFHVPERHLKALQAGQHITFEGVASDAPRTATITYLSPRIDPATRTLEVKARLLEPSAADLPGRFGRVRLLLNVVPDALTVPAAALLESAAGTRVVVANGEDRAEFREVVTGRRLSDRVEIVQGLAAGERVVVEGHQKMGPGVGIAVSPKSAAHGIAPSAATASDGASPAS